MITVFYKPEVERRARKLTKCIRARKGKFQLHKNKCSDRQKEYINNSKEI